MIVFIAEIQGDTAVLGAEESWHCSRVLRKRPGDEVELIDGKGNYFRGRLNVVSDKQCTATLIGQPRHQADRSYYLHLAIAPTKQIDRIEWMLEKAVEVGLDELSVFFAEHSERTKINMDRLRKISESAVKQSLQARLPRLNDPCKFSDLLARSAGMNAAIAHCREGEKNNIANFEFRKRPNLMMIGPEGDFSEKEVKLALDAGFTGLDLGSTRLRTESAGLYVCMAANILSAADQFRAEK